MENYSFRNHALKHFQVLLEHNGFTVQESSNKQLLNSQEDPVLWVSAKCRIQIFREHNKVFIEVAPLAMRTLNDWYPVYVVIAFLSNSKPEDWAWLLGFPKNGFSYEVIDTQLSRWHELVGENIKQVVDLFEEHTFRKLNDDLNKFRMSFYSKFSQLLDH
jgi:hypothetical protein